MGSRTRTDLAGPMVSVLMPVFNAEGYVREAVKSVLEQTFSDFEFILIDDGSTDDSATILRSFSDARINLIHHDQNLGLVAALNTGLEQAKGRYLIRADADDICLPNRIQEQVVFMERHPSIGLSGTWFDNFDSSGIRGGARYASSDAEIRLKHLYQIHISHGTTIFRMEVLNRNELRYDPTFAHAEDYDLFERIGQYCQFGNIPKVLYQVRQHQHSVSRTFTQIQEANSTRVKSRVFSRLGLTIEENELEHYRGLMHQNYGSLKDQAEQVLRLLNNMFLANKESKLFPETVLQDHLAKTWLNFCLANSSRDFAATEWWRQAVFTNGMALAFSDRIKLRVKEWIR